VREISKVHEVLERSAELWPRHTALADDLGTLSYTALCEQATAAEGQLRAAGVGPGQGVGVMARNGRAFVIAAFGALRCGATVLPMSPRLRPAELDGLLAATQLHAVVDDRCPCAQAAFREPCAPVDIPGGTPMAISRTGADPARPCAPLVPDAAFIRFTSGTTGECKGVVLSHQDVLERTAAANRGLALGADDAVIWVLPMAFHFFVSIVLYLRVAATIVVCPDHFAETILDAAEEHRGTLLYASPLHYRLLAAEPSGRRFSTLARAISTAIALPPDVARRFDARFGLPITQAYGIIEVGLPLINLDAPRERPESVGRPLPDYQVAILDDALAPLPAGAEGQLGLRGPGMFAAYLSPASTRDQVLRNGWFLTGDVARQDAEGFVTIVGRRKSMINVAGNKVFPEEVEQVVARHPGVAACRVAGRPHPQMGEVVHADVVLRDPAEPVAVEDLLSFCRRWLTSFKVPHSVAFVSEIAATASGKVRRHG